MPTRFTCLFVGAMILAAAADPSSASRREAQALYDLALKQMSRVETEESVNAFLEVTKADDGFALAHYQIAMLYVSLNNHHDRLRAERALTKAIRLDADNIDYQMAFGDLLWLQGKWEASAHLFSELLEKDPQNARAAYQIGYRSMKEFLKYINMEDYESGVRFTWDHFAVKDRDRAVEYLARSIKLDPSFRDAYYQLGLIFHESNEFGKLIEISKALLGQDPEAKDAYLFCGLGYQMVNDQEQAAEYYSKAVDRMGPEERALMESVDYVVSEEERDKIRETRAEDGEAKADAALATFWRKQDPLFLTDFNERKMEHYGRVAYANLHHSRPSKGLAGWQTDQGMTHIRFGRSLHRRVLRPEVSATSGRMVQAHQETWFYEGFTLTFRNWDGLNGWRFDTTYSLDEPSGLDVFNRTPPRYVDPYLNQKYSVPHQVIAFQNGDSIRLEFSYVLPKNRFNISESGGIELTTREQKLRRQRRLFGAESAADYEVNYVLPEANQIASQITAVNQTGKGPQTTVTAEYEGDRKNDLTYLQIDITRVPSGVHKLTVIVEDTQTGQKAQRDVLLRIIEG